ncbi:hypothetical protein [Blautia sp. MSJ-9]|uniref:hypothetical protein n=1 Tax=Blautia sp. MSJ-9 TaxID=2841511 RepID=UPI001C11B6EE|nr:hypothetical protein [Blautia sp. MSJ-9]MBU5678995.1 hypothetical protein [Blautia sp. MSJ-9]
MKINLTVDEKEILYKLQAMRLSYFQSEPIPRIDREYQEMVADELQQMMGQLKKLNEGYIEFSKQQMHINITLLDVLIYSMGIFAQNDRNVQKSTEGIEEKLHIIAIAKELRQKIVSVLLPDPWFGESESIQRAAYSCYEMINGWGNI